MLTRLQIRVIPTSVPQSLGRRWKQTMAKQAPTVAVLFQDIEPPVINGVRKPRKPGGKHHRTNN